MGTDEIEQRVELTRRGRRLAQRPKRLGGRHRGLERLAASARWPRAGSLLVAVSAVSPARRERRVAGERVQAIPAAEVLQLAQPCIERADARPDGHERAGKLRELPVRRAQADRRWRRGWPPR